MTLFTGTEWDVELIDKIWQTIDSVAQEYGFDYYVPQIEIITAEQMLDCYSNAALPIFYGHWSFGKSFIQNERAYQKGMTGLAYEVVINTNPCIAYLMETNSATMQTLVLSHASVGHSHFFKNNYLFKGWTDADTIIDYLKYARNYIKKCEEKYGAKKVEKLLDACHSLQMHGIDKYKKPAKLSAEMEHQRRAKWNEHEETTFNDLWRTIPNSKKTESDTDISEENLLRFIEKNSPILETWEREIVRIVRKIAQYFYPQRQTQLLNEGFATFVHHFLMTELYDRGHIDEGSYLEFLSSHCNVVAQRDWDSKYYGGINVYALGFAMLTDIKRMCESPDSEDERYFPDLCGKPWLETILDIVANYRDESFVMQFLSPKVIRKFKMFSFNVKEHSGYLKVNATHEDEDYLHIKRALSAQYDLSRMLPDINVVEVDWHGDRTLYLEHITKNNQRLEYRDAYRTLRYVEQLWGFDVQIEYVDLDGNPLEEV